MRQIMLTISLLLVPIAAIANPVVQSGTVNYAANQVTLTGSGFQPNKTAPTVLFDGAKPKVDSSSDALIVATRPSKTAAGTFRLTVKDSLGNFANFDLTYLWRSRSTRPCRPEGAKGPIGERGPEGNWSYWAARTERACWSARWCCLSLRISNPITSPPWKLRQGNNQHDHSSRCPNLCDWWTARNLQ